MATPSLSAARLVAATLLAGVGAACATAARETLPTSGSPAASATGDRPAASEADVRFMQRMIAHHAQALTMTVLVPSHSSREDLRRLAERIAVSQQDEIALMRRWLEDRGQTVPGLDAHQGHHATMPGMLSAAEQARLTSATGAGFDQLFLQYMIRHHEGAVAMVAELFTTQGAGQEPEIFRLASDVDADQRAEIRRMQSLLGAPVGGAPRH